MAEITKLNYGALTQFEPTKTGQRNAALDAARRYAQNIKDWDALTEAVTAQVIEQKEFVGWWDGAVSVREKNRKLSADRGTVPMAEAERETNITNQQVSRWRKKLRDEDKYKSELFGAAYKAAMAEKTVRGTEGTGDNEWYTPAEYLERAREALGDIDLDPASNIVAQHTVGAANFFTIDDNGLTRDWNGRVWLNPPYAQPYIAQFVTKLVGEVRAGRVAAAILLTHNYTDTAWFHEAAGAANAICFTRGRIKFYEPDGTVAAPTQGQAFSYFGGDVARFAEAFADVGFVVVRR